MKKAKIILTAIGVFAIVGGALAFKAAKFAQKNVYCTTSGACLTTSYRTQILPGAISTTTPCVGTTNYFTAPACPVATTGRVYFTNVQ